MQHLAAIIGAVTLLVAGTIALVQWDIKRVIAYSTMSQIGYMFLAAGVGAYDFAMFHLMTHAFFKALLFLGAGIVIHRLGGEQDIRKMGGLRKSMPVTAFCFLIGTLALIGIPPLAGFWSKDAILASALATGGVLGGFLYLAGLVGAVLTGMYALRLYLLVFHGEQSAEAAAALAADERARATSPRARRGAVVDADPGRDPDRPRDVRRLRRHPGCLHRVRRLDQQRRRAARRADRSPGLRDELHRSHLWRDRDHDRLVHDHPRP